MNKQFRAPRCPEIREKHKGQSRQRIRQLEYAKIGICGICYRGKLDSGFERCPDCTLKFRLSIPCNKRFPAIWKENKPKLIKDLKALDWGLPLAANAEKLDLTVDQLKRYRRRYLGIKCSPGRPRKNEA